MATPHSSLARTGLVAGLALAMLAGCGEESGEPETQPVSSATPVSTYPSAPRSSGPEIPRGGHHISGDVFAAATGPVVGAGINVWIQTDTIGYSYWIANGPLYSDQSGRFSATYLPDSTVTVMAFDGAYLQPCAAIVDSRSKEPVRLEVIPVEAFDTIEPPRPSIAREPSLTGTVYEMTPEGRKPVTGAQIWIEHGSEIQTARALSGREGRYYVCNLPPEVAVYATKSGYVMTSVWPVDTSKGVPLDIEVRRVGS